MKIVHIASFDPGNLTTGPSNSVSALVQAHDELAGVCSRLINLQPMTRSTKLRGAALATGRRGDLGGIPPQDRAMLEGPDRPDLVLFHSTYFPPYAAIARWLSRRRIPYLIVPRGGLTHHAAQYSRWKKKTADALFFKRFVREAVALQCLSQKEAEASKGWGRPIFVIPNGIDLPSEPMTARAGVHPSEPLRAIFVGRMDMNHKGLDLLIEAVAKAKEHLDESVLRVEIFGPDTRRGGWKQLQEMIRKVGVPHLVHVRGPVVGEEKAKVLAASDLFLLTSRFEGMPMGLLEAFAYGLPVLVTPGTTLSEEVGQSGAGWVAEPSAESIAERLLTVVNHRAELAWRGQRARQLAETQFTWKGVAEASVEQYRQLLH